MICKSEQFNIDSINNRSQCNYISRASDCDNRGALSTTRATKCCTRRSLAKSFFSNVS